MPTIKPSTRAMIKKFQSDLAKAIGEDIAEDVVKGSLATVGYTMEEEKEESPETRPGRGNYVRNMTCRAEGCTRRSKGPRFHYLCDKHLAEFVRKGARKSARK